MTLSDALASFIAAHDHLTEVYALAVVLSPEGQFVHFALADEPSMEAALSEAYPDVRPRWEEQFWGTRWNPGDFPHMSTVDVAARLDDALKALEKVPLARLDTMDEFVAFVAMFDQSEADRKEWMRKTIPEGQFERLFPDLVAFERFMDEAADSPPAEQARFWAAAMEDLALQLVTPRSAQLAQLGRTQYDANDALVALGKVAVGPLLDIVERYALQPEFTEPGSLAHQRHGAISGESKLTTAAMFALGEIGDLEDAQVARLQDVLAALVAAYPPKGRVGVTAAVAARVLHALRPQQFPAPQIDDETNRLAEPESFCAS